MDFVVLNPTRLAVVVAKAKRDTYRSLADLSGRTAVTFRNTAYESWLLEQNQTALSEPAR